MTQTNIETMGSLELQEHKEKIHNSMLSSEEKHNLLKKIEQRENSLNQDTAMVEFSEIKED